MPKLSKLICEITYLAGACPVQGEGYIGQFEFYFRARGRGWRFEVYNKHRPAIFNIAEEWGDGPYDAGYMPVPMARDIVEECIELFMTKREHELNSVIETCKNLFDK